MHVRLIAVGTRMPTWVQTGFNEYAKRLPREWAFQVHEIPLGNRSQQAETSRLIELEGVKMLRALPAHALSVALDSLGTLWSTEELAQQLDSWLHEGRELAFLIGGPDGLAPACLERSEKCWSLSRLTFPHSVVRILIAEQLYRAWSLLQGHPYHR